MTSVASVFSPPIPFADAPDPAHCPNHQCNYHPVTPGGIAAGLVVAIVVAVLLVLLAVALRHRRRRRHRAGQAGQ